MWSTPDKPVPRYQLERDALDTLQKAIDECVEFDVSERPEVSSALNLVNKRGPRDQGVRLFEKGMKEPDPIKRRNDLRHAFEKILMQTGLGGQA